MNMTTIVLLAVLVVLVVAYMGRRRSRLKREDRD
jgi:hypothetical protein